jgi:deoxyribodipyrimidine photo-lyase
MQALLTEARERGKAVPEVSWAVPGEAAAREALVGPQGFLSPARLAMYENKRNDPAEPKVSVFVSCVD